ncbi:hypothetical protein BKA62DRAFT_713225 [Auriculariales sp. MPI-PUGE-AT-0066]|nr:hypothetical protein BKA62DRAFT_713225 [Auriculariales sp. MPI-PUGE-AT-0066]
MNTPARPRASQSNASLGTPHSCPSASTGHTATCSARPIPKLQEELKERVLKYLKGRVWEFSCKKITEMISPGMTLDEVNKLDAEVAKLGLDTLLEPVLSHNEKLTYKPLAIYLNAALKIAKDLRDRLSYNSGGDGYLQNPFFREYDRKTSDRIFAAARLLPDITGEEVSCLMGYGPDTMKRGDLNLPVLHIEIAVEVKSNWKDLLAQVGTYARASFYGSPLRRFVVCIGINQVDKTFCVFLFHAGGVAASQPLGLSEGREDLIRFLLAILLWRNVEDAGIVSDGVRYTFPSPKENEPPVDLENLELLHRRVDLVVAKLMLTTVQCGRRTTCFTSLGVDSASQDSSDGQASQSQLRQGTSQKRRASGDAELDAEQPNSKRLKAEEPTSGATSSHRSKSFAPSDGLQSTSSHFQTISLQPDSKSARIKEKRAKEDAEAAAKKAVLDEIQQRRGAERRTTLIAPHEKIIADGDLDYFPNEAVIKFSWQQHEKRLLEAKALAACSGRFGTPSFVYTLTAADNLSLLPQSETDAKFCDVVALDRRVFCATVCADVGMSLECCKSPWDLGRALLDCQLGWLGVLQSDILHRDVSIGNLLLLKTPVPRQAYCSSLLPDRYKTPELKDACNDYMSVTGELSATLADLGVSDKCTAIITDFDLSTRMDQPSKSHGFLSGTREFMSSDLFRAVERQQPYLQSVVDDLWAFFNVAVWVILFTWRVEIRQEYEKRDGAQAEIVNGAWLRRAKKSKDQAKLNEYSDLLKAFLPVLQDWHAKLKTLDSLDDSPLDSAEGLQHQILAAECVRDFAGYLLKHRSSLNPVA